MAKTIYRFSQDQIDRANAVNVVDYARSQGMEIVHSSGEWYRAKHQGGLYFKRNANTWHWETQDVGGRGAISLCMKLEDKTWKEAVKTLLDEEMDEIRHEDNWRPEPETPKEFVLPDKNSTYRHVFAYLIKHRGIDAAIVKKMVEQDYIYENTQRSCVFVGKDKDGVARHASVRSTNTEGYAFKQDVAGSQKAYSFSISGSSGIVNVCEAPIDVLSYMTLQKIHGITIKDSYVALGGVTDKALERFLNEHTDIQKIRVCTDHDEAGEGALRRIYEKYSNQYVITRQRPIHKDFNEDLVVLREREYFNKNQISEESIQWYQENKDKCQVGTYQKTGNTTNVFLCTDKVEALAIRDLRYKEWNVFAKSEGIQSDIIPRDNYLICTSRDREQLLQQLEAIPPKQNVYVCVNETEQGAQLKALMKEHMNNGYQYCTPQSGTFQSDLAISNAAAQVIETAAVVQELEVGMEL